MSKLHIIWDLDGTLINSEKEVLEALILSVREVGLSETIQKAPFRVGPTIDKILDKAFGEDVITIEKKHEIVSLFRKNYDNCGFNKTSAFDGIAKIIQDKNYINHIVTNKPDLATNRILGKLGWIKYFASVITPYSFMQFPDDKLKSKAELFSICMSRYPDEKFIGIGDMDTDVNAALTVGIPAIGVLWGTGTKEDLNACKCTLIAEDVSELESILKKIQ